MISGFCLCGLEGASANSIVLRRFLERVAALSMLVLSSASLYYYGHYRRHISQYSFLLAYAAVLREKNIPSRTWIDHDASASSGAVDFGLRYDLNLGPPIYHYAIKGSPTWINVKPAADIMIVLRKNFGQRPLQVPQGSWRPTMRRRQRRSSTLPTLII